MILGYFGVTESISGVKFKFQVDFQDGRRQPSWIVKFKVCVIGAVILQTFYYENNFCGQKYMSWTSKEKIMAKKYILNKSKMADSGHFEKKDLISQARLEGVY